MLLCLETSSRSKTHRTSYEDIERREKERVEKEERKNKMFTKLLIAAMAIASVANGIGLTS